MEMKKRLDSSVTAQYDRVARSYDSRWAGYVTSTLREFSRRLDLTGKESVLDIACGTGELERILLGTHGNLNITGIDISNGMLNVAQQKLRSYPNVRFYNADVENLPFSDDSFDIVLCANAFHYFRDPIGSLREMRRVLTPGGTIAVMDWCRDYLLCSLYDLFLKTVDPAHMRCFTKQELVRFFSNAGLSISLIESFRTRTFWGLMISIAG